VLAEVFDALFLVAPDDLEQPDRLRLEVCLADIEERVASEPIERTALIFVGPSLASDDFRESALYDPAYQRRFRDRQRSSDSSKCALA